MLGINKSQRKSIEWKGIASLGGLRSAILKAYFQRLAMATGGFESHSGFTWDKI